MELLIGAGNSRVKQVYIDKKDWTNLITLDIDPKTKPDVVWDLDRLPYPFKTEQFEEIHAYDVLEHQGSQGDWKFFFNQFKEFWRILKPKGRIFILVPHHNSMWALGDPGHRRVMPSGMFTFLEQSCYEQVGTTPMCDYRFIWDKDFKRLVVEPTKDNEKLLVILEKQGV